MPHLEIRQRTGSIETRVLSRDAPLLVGSMAGSDVLVEAEGVAPVECRISWRRGKYEVDAATPRGVQWNGKLVRQAPLGAGDVLRVGDVDIILRDDAGAAEPAAQISFAAGPEPPRDWAEMPSDEYQLRPTSDDEVPLRFMKGDEALLLQPEPPPPAIPRETGPARPVPPARPKGPQRPAPQARPRSHKSALPLRDAPRRAAESQPPPPAAPPAPVDAGAQEAVPEPSRLLDEVEPGPQAEEPAARLLRAAPGPAPPGLGSLLRSAPRRPGEQELARSPLVVGLTLATGALALAAVTIWFVLARETLQRQFDGAQAQLEAGLYLQAIEAFEQFAKDHPRHPLAAAAREAVAQARVRQALAGAEPDWQAALDALNALLAEYRDSDQFRPPESRLRLFALQQAELIAKGAAEAAGRLKKRALLAVSEQAARLAESYSAPDNRPEQALAAIAASRAKATAAILQQEIFDAAQARMQEAKANGNPMPGYTLYRQLLDRYPQAASHKPLDRALRDLIEFERMTVVREARDRPAQTQEDASVPKVALMTLARLTRSRSDLISAGTTAFAATDDGVFAHDAATGDPLWRRSLGLDRPFQAQRVSASAPAVLLYSTRTQEVLLVRERGGELLWRQSVPGVAAAPLVHQGQIFLVTSAGTLEQLDLETGEHSATLKFLQPLVGTPAASLDGERLFVPGRQDVLYVLGRRPLGLQQVVWSGHGEGAIATGGLVMGSYLLLAENDRIDRARLKVFEIGATGGLKLIDTEELQGHVLDPPVIRGTQLVVPSTGERITAFQVAETGDDKALSRTASFQVPDGAGGPIHVVLGADDQLWMASTALRRFTIKTDSIAPDQRQLAVGIATQAPAAWGESLIVGRRLPFSRAVLLAEADRQRMLLNWQATLGAAVIEAAVPAGSAGAATYITSAGDLFRLDLQRVLAGGFEGEPTGRLALPKQVEEPLGACRLADGRAAVWCGGPNPRLWLVAHAAQPVEIPLDAPLQAAPVSCGPGLLLPLAGKLRLVGLSAGAPAVEDLPAPQGKTDPPRWLGAAAVDQNVAAVLDGQGRLARVEFREAPLPHLAEVANWNSAAPVELGLGHDRELLAVFDTALGLTLLDAASLEPVGTWRADLPASVAPRLVGGRVLVELARDRLVCLERRSGGLEPVWQMPLRGSALCGWHLAQPDDLVVALDDGTVLRVQPADGRIGARLRLPMRLAWGPAAIGEALVAGTHDGGLIELNEVLRSATAAPEVAP